jgi:membrane-bound lytic murein transglycosylase D
MADLQQLNPSLLRKVVPENGRWHTVRVPLHTKAALRNNRWVILDSARQSGKQQLEALAKQAVGNTHGREQIEYRVKSGDVLGSIALRHRVSVADIRQWNNLAGNMIRVGQRLVLWVPPSQPVINPAPAAAVAITPDNKTYTVQPGDTLWGISNKFQGLTIQKIKTLNNLKSSQLKPGQKLIIG